MKTVSIRWPRRVRTPMVLQMEAVECGAASLAIVLGHHRRVVPLSELRQACGVSRDGSKASNVLKAARIHGLEARGYSKRLEDLAALAPPYVVFWHFNHFLVVEGFGRRRVHLNDPALGHRSVTWEEFDEGFTGVVLVFEKGADFQPGGRPPGVFGALRRRLAGFHGALLYCLLAGFFLTIPGILVPALSQVYLDQVLVEGHEHWLRPVVLAMVALGVVQGVLAFLQRRYLRRLRLALATRLSAGFFWHLLRLPASFYAQRYAGELVGRSALNGKVAAALSGQLAQAAISAVMMAFYAVVMVLYDGWLSAIAFGAALLHFVVLRAMARARVEDQSRVLQAQGKVHGLAVGALQNMETIKAAGQEDGFFARWAGAYANATNTATEVALRNVRVGVIPRLVTPLASLAVLALGALRVIDGALTIGMLVAFQSLMTRFLEPVTALVGLGETIQRLRADLLRLDDVLENPVDPSLAAPTTPPDAQGHAVRLEGTLEVRNLTFGYSPMDPPLIEDLSLTLQPGARVALVGGSGSGKSTIARLICGLYAPWSGEILFDGRRREELPDGVLPASLALVDQDVLLFEGSVRDNLTLWDDTVPQPHLVEALRDAELLDAVRALPGALDGMLAEGGRNLSGGQRQRLEIARALVNQPRLLVLDEATSALDAETERLISERLRLRGCACVLVAHRLSTIRDCEEIIVLERGKVVERGTHQDLWRAGGAYARLLAADDAAVAEGHSA